MLKFKLRQYFSRFFSYLITIGFKAYFKFIKYNRVILIYTPGKVGSASIYNNLKRLKISNVFHLHYLNPVNIEKQINLEKQSDRKSIPLHLILSTVLYKKLVDFKKIDIICLSRDPYQRHISSYFQNIYRDKRNFLTGKYLDTEYIIDKLKLSLPLASKELDYWFETELNNVFNINIFKEYEEKYILNCFKRDNVTVYFMKTENLNDINQSNLIKKIIGRNFKKDISIKKINDSSNRFYFNDYKSIKNRLKSIKINLIASKTNRIIYK